MPIKPEEVELGKSYQLANGTIRRVFEIVPDTSQHLRRGEVSDKDLVRYEAEKWGYDKSKHNGQTRIRMKMREKMCRCDFAKEACKRLD